MTVGTLSAACARRHPEKAATICGGQVRSFCEFDGRVNRLASALSRRGLEQGDKVAVLSTNNAEVLEVMFACAKAGFTYVPINFRLAPPELKFVINDAGVKTLFVGDRFASIIQQIQGEIICRDVLDLRGQYEAVLATGSTEEPAAAVSGSDLFAIFYTSGTTSGPKGVMLTHDNFLAAAINHVIAYQLAPSDVCYHVMPFYHAMEASMAACHFYVGGTNVIPDQFSGDQFWNDVKQHGVTNITLVFTMLADILDAFERGGHQRGPLRTFSAGGQSVPVEIIRRTARVLGPDLLFQVYGLTEAAPLLTYLPRTEMPLQGPRAKRLGSIGKEMFSCHVRVVNDRDEDVKPGQLGEIIARGPNVMVGYWKRPDETAAALRGGWLRTGDVATVDDEGYIYIVDRKKDLIISGGENISPREVEEAILQHPQVRFCSVIGGPDARWGEQVRAVVVLANAGAVNEKELIAFCKERLAGYKLPKRVFFVDELPKDPVGKIQKRVLRERFGKDGV